jgi:ATP-binding cassette subfamily C protein
MHGEAPVPANLRRMNESNYQPAPAETSGPTDLRSMIAMLWSFAGYLRRSVPYGIFAGAAFLSVIAGIMEGVSLTLLAPLVGLLGNAKPQSGLVAAVGRSFAAFGLPLSLEVLIAGFVVVMVVRALVTSARDLALETLSSRFIEVLRTQLYDVIVRADWSFVARQRISNLSKALTTDVETVGHGTQFFFRFAALGTLALVQVAVALAFAPLLTAAVLACGLLIAIGAWRWRRNTFRASQMFGQAQQSAYDEMNDCLAALKLAKSHNAEDYNRIRFRAADTAQHRYYLAVVRKNAETQTLTQVSAALALGIFVYAGASVFGLNAAELLLLIFVFARLMPTLAEIQNSTNVVQLMLPIYDKLMRLMSACAAAREHLPDSAEDRLTVRREIRVAGLNFNYSGVRGTSVLRGLDMTIPAHSIVAISGASGAGKSTLADMLLGLLVPDSGNISIDGAPLTPARLAAWRRSVAYIPQDIVLFNETIRANVLWGSYESADKDVENALAQTGMAEIIAAMPQGVETVIGERGNQLSGGQRQRLALARALLRQPTLLILDEATNALDEDSESSIWTLLERLRSTTTILIIAHRDSTLRKADYVAVMENGVISQFGEWSEIQPAARTG